MQCPFSRQPYSPFPIKRPLPKAAHDCAFPSVCHHSLNLFSFSVSGPNPSQVSLVFLQGQGHLSSTSYQSPGLNRSPDLHPSPPYSGIYFPFNNGTSISPEFCQHFLYQNLHLYPPFSWQEDCCSQFSETLLASLCPTLLRLSLSVLVPSLTLDGVFLSGRWSFLPFVPVLFPCLLIKKIYMSKKILVFQEHILKYFCFF